MKTPPLAWRRTALAASAFCLALAPQAQAQLAPAPSGVDDSQKQTTAKPAMVDDASSAPDGDTVVLSPFIVTADEDDGYQATATTAGTRIRTDLRDVSSALSVITSSFLKDTGATNNQTLLQYVASTEVGGIGGNYAGINGAAGASLQDNQRAIMQSPSTSTRVRGLDAADNARNLFITNLPWDGYNVGRVDVQRGPNSILYGLGAPSGIINTVTNVASFRNSGKLEYRYGSYGTQRGTLEVNRELIDDELAILVDALVNREKFQQKPAFNDDERIYFSAKWDPAFLQKNGMRTSVRASYEAGKIEANRPRFLPPGDLITPWFSYMNKKTVNHLDAWWQRKDATGNWVPGYNTVDPNNKARDWSLSSIAGGIQSGPLAVFQQPDATVPNYDGNPLHDNMYLTPKTLGTWGINQYGQLDGGIGGNIYAELVGIRNYGGSDGYAANVLRGPNTIGAKDWMITDTSIFDFYNQLLDGPNKGEWQRFNAKNIALEQTFFNGRAGFEVAFDQQHYVEGQTSLLSTSYQAIQIDINQLTADGLPNPNLGRPFIAARPSFGNNENTTDRDSFRATAFGEFRFTDIMKRSWLTNLLGKHRVTGMFAKDQIDEERQQWTRYVADSSFAEFVRFPGSPGYPAAGYEKIDGQARSINLVAYLGPSLLDRSSAAGIDLPGLQATMLPTSGNVRVYDSHWKLPENPTAEGYVNPNDPWLNPWTWDDPATPLNEAMSTQSENPANYAGWGSRPLNVMNADNGDRYSMVTGGNKTRTRIASQAVVWQGYFLKDTIIPTVGYREDSMKRWSLEPGRSALDQARLVKDPGYVFSSGTQAETINTHIMSWGVVVHTPQFINKHLPWGMNFSAFFNNSKNFQPDAGRWGILGQTVESPNGTTKDYGIRVAALNERISFKINWFETVSKNAQLDWGDVWKVSFYEAWSYLYAKQAEQRFGPFGSDWTPTEEWTKAHQAYFQNAAPDSWYKTWGIDTSKWNSWMQPERDRSLFKITGDRTSKGIEFEFAAQPVKGLNVTMNASKVEAINSNTDPALAKWIEERAAVYAGPAGDVRIWGPSGPKIGTMYLNEIVPSYALLRAREGQATPELRKWRFNLVANYTFGSGLLKNFNVGGGYRWEDKVGIGYAMVPYEGSYRYDVNQPFWGPSEDHIDLWVGYEREVFRKIKWRIQFNVRDLFAKNKLIPLSTQPDGTVAGVRIQSEQMWTLTNTFSF